MTQKRLKEIQAETELDYEPVNMRVKNLWMNETIKSRSGQPSAREILVPFAILIGFGLLAIGALYLNSIFY